MKISIKSIKDIYNYHWKDTKNAFLNIIDQISDFREIIENDFISKVFEKHLQSFYNNKGLSSPEHKLNYLKTIFDNENSFYELKKIWSEEWINQNNKYKITSGEDLKNRLIKYYGNINTFTYLKGEEIKDKNLTESEKNKKLEGTLKNFLYKNVIFAFQNEENELLDILISREPKFNKNMKVYSYSGANYGNFLNKSQLIALNMAHTNKILNIKGPPGTGKSTLLKDMAASILLNGKTIEITSSNNQAVDNIKGIFSNDEILNKIPILRLGNIGNCNRTFENLFLNFKTLEKFVVSENKENAKDPSINKEINYLLNKDWLNQNIKNANNVNSDLNEILNFKPHIRKMFKSNYIKKIKKKVIKLINKNNFISIIINYFRWKKIYKKLNIINLKTKINIFKLNKNKLQESLFKINQLITFLNIKNSEDKELKNQQSEKKILENIQKKSVHAENLLKLWINEKIEIWNDKIPKIKKYIQKFSDEKNSSGYILKKMYIGKKAFNDKNNEINQILPSKDSFRNLFPISLTTTLAANNFQEIDKSDYLIIDEAAQTSIQSILGNTHNFKNLILLGDTSQLDAVMNLNLQKEKEIYEESKLPEIYRNYKNSIPLIIEKTFPFSSTIMLNEHWRCVPSIANFFNKYYNNDLIIKRKDTASKKDHILMTFYKGSFEEKEIKKIQKQYSQEISKQDQTIAIMSPFKKINNLETTIIKKGTTHEFQGYENKIIIYYISDLSKLTNYLINNFLDDKLINVAVSRAKNKFHLFLPEKTRSQILKNKNSQMFQLIKYIQTQEKESSLKFKNNFDRWKNIKINYNLTKNEFGVIGEIKKELFELISAKKMFFSLGVRDIDVNSSIKDIENQKEIFDLAVFNEKGKIIIVINKNEVIFSANKDLELEINKLSFKSNIIFDQAKDIMTVQEAINFKQLTNSLKAQGIANKIIMPAIAIKRILNKHKRKMHFDFVFCDYSSNKKNLIFKMKFALEIDDSTHNLAKSQINDKYKNNICLKNGIDLFRIKI